MANFKTPGVYIQEISRLPASIAPVATAIPAFVGYTEKAEPDGKALETITPVRITSLLEYEQVFGGPFPEIFEVTIDDPLSGEVNPDISVIPEDPGLSPYLMYYQLRMYFGNGGGPCYVVSVGNYNDSGPTANHIKDSDLSAGIDICEKIDEITLLVVPEAIVLESTKRKIINDALVTQCNKLKDRFAIIDVFSDPAKTVTEDGDDFRNEIGADYLRYGAAYYPALRSALIYFYKDSDVTIIDERGNNGFFNNSKLNNLIDNSLQPEAAKASITIRNNSSGEVIIINGHSFEISSAGTKAEKAEELKSDIVNELADILEAEVDDVTINLTAKTMGSSGNTIAINYPANDTSRLEIEPFSGGHDSADHQLYNLIKKKIEAESKLNLYPSAAMAGVYARTDRDRGVWKAPANVSLRLVESPMKLISSEEQAPLNVD